MRRSSKKFASLRPYVAETGAVVYRALAVFLLLAGVGEFLHPGFLASVVSPTLLIALAIVAAAAALIEDAENRARASWIYAATAAVIVVGATWASWYLWIDIPGARNALTFAVGVVLAMAFFYAGRTQK
ncbi:MAG: hypothetical protein AAB692_02740 [Patescibacteria group bacterium]